MKINIETYYKTRSGKLAYVTSIDPTTDIWPYLGNITPPYDNLLPDASWTSFGGASCGYNHKNDLENPKWEDADDLILELTEEDYPEYYL